MSTYTAPMPRNMFGPASLLRVDLSAAPLDADSPALVAALAGQVAELYGGMAAFNAYRYGAAVHVVGADVPLVPVAFRDEQRKGYLPPEFAPGGELALAPIPPDALAAAGTDGHLAVFAPATGRLFEFWRARRDGAGAWSAVWGGRIDDVATSTGFYRPHTGVCASGVALPAVAVGIDEVRYGRIDHAIGIAITRVAKGPCYPANRSDGYSVTPDALHEGRRFRLRADVDLDALRRRPTWSGDRGRPVTRTCRIIAAAAKVHGLIVTDRSQGVSVAAEQAQQSIAATGIDPWRDLNAGTPDWGVLDGFPWDRLEALPFDYGKPVATAPTTAAGGVR